MNVKVIYRNIYFLQSYYSSFRSMCVLPAFVSMHHLPLVSLKARRGLQIPQTWVSVCFEWPQESWESSMCLLNEHPVVFLSPELSLHPMYIIKPQEPCPTTRAKGSSVTTCILLLSNINHRHFSQVYQMCIELTLESKSEWDWKRNEECYLRGDMNNVSVEMNQ